MKARILALLVFVLSLSVLVYASGKINETENSQRSLKRLSQEIFPTQRASNSASAPTQESAWHGNALMISVRSRERQSFKHTKRSRTFFRLGLKMSLLHPFETMSGFRARSMY